MTEHKRLRQIIKEAVAKALMEHVSGNSPDYCVCFGDTYEALVDTSFPVILHRNRWESKGDTHRDTICLDKLGCMEFEMEDYYGSAKAKELRPYIDALWSSSEEYSMPSRVFDAKEGAAKRGYRHVLVSWDQLEEKDIEGICDTFGLDKETTAVVR